MEDQPKKTIAAITRTVIQVGGSLAITLPQPFIKLHDIRQGDLVAIVGTHLLTVHPPERPK